MSTLFWLSVFVMSAILFDHVQTQCSSHGHVNGCSIPGGWPYFYKSKFRSDCNKHDICYYCGQRKRISRSQCDRRFYNDLKQTCRNDRTIRNKIWCRMVTTDYYTGVRLGGSSHYENRSPSWCGQSWVGRCLRS